MKMDVDTVLKAFGAIGFKGYALTEGKETRFIGTFCGQRKEDEEEYEELFIIKNNQIYDLGSAEGDAYKVCETNLIDLLFNEHAISFLKILEVKNVLVMRKNGGEMALSFPRKRRFMEMVGFNCMVCRLGDAIKNYETLELCL